VRRLTHPTRETQRVAQHVRVISKHRGRKTTAYACLLQPERLKTIEHGAPHMHNRLAKTVDVCAARRGAGSAYWGILFLGGRRRTPWHVFSIFLYAHLLPRLPRRSPAALYAHHRNVPALASLLALYLILRTAPPPRLSPASPTTSRACYQATLRRRHGRMSA